MFKRKEKRIDEALLRLAAIVESSDDAIFSKTLDGVITSWNKGAEKLYGYKRKEIVGQHVSMLVPEEKKEELWQILDDLKKGKKIEHKETVRIKKDGSRVDISASISPLKDKNGHFVGASVIVRDITQSKDLERRKDEFISIASHELKTPVTSLKGYTQILQMLLKDSEPANTYLIKMDNQLDRLTALVNDLLDVSKIQAGKLELRTEEFGLQSLLKDLISDAQPTTTHFIKFKSKKEIKITADKFRLSQVIINFLSNAIKYSPKAKTINVTLQQKKGEVLVSVQDFGIGIAKGDLYKIFEPFYQADSTIRQSYAGLGLGLHISYEIISRHNGRIWVKSEKGKGSTFSFSLPI